MLTATELEQVRDDLRERINSLTADLRELRGKCRVSPTFVEEVQDFTRLAARIDADLYELAPIND